MIWENRGDLMGGIGSSRWIRYTKKILVEDCYKLSIKDIKSNLKPGFMGLLTWTRHGKEAGRIVYKVNGLDLPLNIKLSYSITKFGDEKRELEYIIPLTTTNLPWGGHRYWFLCPLRVYGRRVRCLYLPPRGYYFGCRHCHDLTYKSSQESHKNDNLYKSLALSMQEENPLITWRDVKKYINLESSSHKDVFSKNRKYYNQKIYDDLITRDQLCEQSGLSKKDLERLETIRLLLPDKDDLYRPKLAGWGRKLAFLLDQGWDLNEIKAWAKGRWKTSNPRQWPPRREDWMEK